jgi:signal transduction histidine kinase
MRAILLAEDYWNQRATRTIDHITQWSNYRARIEKSRRFEEKFAFNEGIAVPLCYGAKVYGVSNIYFTQPVPIGHEELDLLLLLGPLLYGAVRRDIHIRDIETLSEQLREASRHKSEFLAGMSHELRTPLNAIRGFSELLLEGVTGPLTEKQQRHINHILSGGRHLLELINDILDLSKVEAGKLNIETTLVNLPGLISDVMAVTEPLAHRKGVSLHTDGEPGLPSVSADPLRIKPVLLNIVSHAIKVTPQGGRVMIRLWQDGDAVAVSVSDTGIGISPEEADKLFREFTQLSRRNDQPTEGTGLGLALAKRLVEMHGGRIWAESEGEGRGSTFQIRLPLGN